ncbi:uncharacterized protein DUF1707 [Haloactinopolyspora alba]|uniref:Uncharacterized protein DUF1707 n=1 Tax=Haloactinopolyspora alba TaxID=648780 RepID=A0A2P8DX39_9ACTN|nr:DUF1707 domain-containing protein [Haloactinopolyspora alba]PSL01781.1 uncharacterized protein DUF1707 [Haloactinopolyspora alba]
MSDDTIHRPEYRASDDDRDVVAGDLRDAFGEGRLDQDEYERRLDAAWQARTYGELDLLTADLPQPLERQRAQVRAEQQRKADERQRREMAQYFGEWKAWLGGAVIMIGIWAITGVASGEVQNFWPGVPLAIWAVVLLAGGLGGRCAKD